MARIRYYSRARNMQAAAQQIVFDYKGQWPKTAKELEKLKGIGLIRRVPLPQFLLVK